MWVDNIVGGYLQRVLMEDHTRQDYSPRDARSGLRATITL